MNEFLRDPTWSKVHVSTVLGTIALFVMLLNALVRARLRKRDLYKLPVLLTELHAHHEVNGSVDTHGANDRATPAIRRRAATRASALSVICVAVSAIAFLFSLRGYTILTNWQDGHEKDFLGDPVGAIICYKKALRVDRSLSSTHLFIGESLYASGRVRAAIPELQTAAEDEQGSLDAVALLGDAYQALNQPDQAIVEYKKASALAPVDAGYQLVLGVCLEKVHRWTEAADAYESALRLEPSNALAHIRLGMLLVNSGKREEGMAHCKRAVMLAPRSVLAHNTLGTAYAQYYQFGDARAEYRIAVALNPQFLIGHVNLGFVLEKMNLPEQALVHFKDCTRIASSEKQDKQDSEERDLLVRVRSEIRRLEVHKKTGALASVAGSTDHMTPRSGR